MSILKITRSRNLLCRKIKSKNYNFCHESCSQLPLDFGLLFHVRQSKGSFTVGYGTLKGLSFVAFSFASLHLSTSQ